MAAGLAALGAGALLVVAADKVSKRVASPGVADHGLPGRSVPGLECPAVAPAGPPSGENRLIVVFGATGSSGVAVVETALEVGYFVRAFVRSASRLLRELRMSAPSDRLEVVEGNLEDEEAVEATMAGAHAVISVAGARPVSAPGPMAAAVRSIVRGCRKHCVRKFVYQASALSMVPGERWGLFTPARMASAVERYQNGNNTVNDNTRAIRYLYNEAGDVDWVVSRPPGLEEGERQGPLAPTLEPFRPGCIRWTVGSAVGMLASRSACP